MMITVKSLINENVRNVWNYWIMPEHIVNWNFASDDWCCPQAENDAKPGGKFSWRMEAKDGSMGFDYSGIYKEVVEPEKIELVLDDGRKVVIVFAEKDGQTEVAESFEPDQMDQDLQRQGWQAILDNFKKYVESR